MLRLRHICAQTRGGGEGDCPSGPSQTPRVRNNGPAKPKYVSEIMFTFVNSGATDQIFSTARTGTACAIWCELRQPHAHHADLNADHL